MKGGQGVFSLPCKLLIAEFGLSHPRKPLALYFSGGQPRTPPMCLHGGGNQAEDELLEPLGAGLGSGLGGDAQAALIAAIVQRRRVAMAAILSICLLDL